MFALFIASFIGGAIAQRLFGRLAVSISLPLVAYVLWSTYQEFFVPYSTGGASFWPIDMFFAGPVAAFGGALGAFAVIKFSQARSNG